ncbi:MAG: PorP/SprF family type IX secretion system membrane protein [Bacteroidales bacterium]|jgi:type IX secretion system PorP/SprF family membrane protein
MKLKSNITFIERILLTILFVSAFSVLEGQQTPLFPVSYWVFTPYIYNPAIVGSKDFLSIGVNAAFQGNSNSQLISGNARISKTKSGYYSSPDILEFKNIGIGGSVFKDINGLSRNIGVSASFSYQVPLNTSKLSFLSFGVSVKGVYNTLDNDSVGPAHSFKKTFFPDFDLGIYYYGTSFFTGLSSTNIHGNPWKSDSLGIFKIPVSRQYFFTAGLKILLSKPMNIVLEPSVLIFANDSTIRKISENINPILKLYLEDFCFGTSFHSGGKISFFSQFRYPRFYVGAFYELPEKTAYFKRSPIVEFTLGINILPDKSRFSNHSHW